jgi:Na+-transporting NADH:ubiquinone oxidoreductase subunit NqrF
LYVQLSKKRWKLQAKVDVANNMEVCIKVKQFNANMWKQITIVLKYLINFLDCFKL